MSNVSKSVEGYSPGIIDRVETFAEPDVTVSHTQTQVVGESVIFDSADDVRATGTYQYMENEEKTYNYTFSQSSPDYLVVNKTLGNGPGVKSVSVDGVEQTANGDGEYNLSGMTAPIDVTVVTKNYAPADFRDGAFDIIYTYGETTGTTFIEIADPEDIFAWDRVLYNADPDGGTIEVDIEESSDGGSNWTKIATNVSRGEDITATPENLVRLAINMDRADTVAKPTVDAVYRRFTV